MTARAFDPEKVRKELAKRGIDLGWAALPPLKKPRKVRPVSGKELARRLGGILTRKKADELEGSIQKSCEQVND